MKIKAISLSLIILFFSLKSIGQTTTPSSLKIIKLISAINCPSDTCIKEMIKGWGYIYSGSEKNENGITYNYQENNMGNWYGDNPKKTEFLQLINLMDGYAYFLGLATKNKPHRDACFNELSQLSFKKTEDKNQSPQSANGVSYKSSKYPRLTLTYFESKDENNKLLYSFSISRVVAN